MFQTCIRCYSDLGNNETIEAFPTGRRLAFDAAKGRLWVVCRKCERWNLTPLEERWEAIEDCERRFSGTKLRVSTDNIGLARVGDGLDLVRIGSALRPEMAAWRYGDQFGRRRLRHRAAFWGGIAMSGLFVAGMRYGIMAGGGLSLLQMAYTSSTLLAKRRTLVRVRVPGHDKPVLLRRSQLDEASITNTGSDWVLSFPFLLSLRDRLAEIGKPRALVSNPEFTTDLRGEDAMRAAAKILPAINAQGARPTEVKAAAGLLEETPHAAGLFQRFAPRSERWLERHVKFSVPERQYLSTLTSEVRLALEMAANEENERRAMEGELAHLEMEWRDAEEIAQIADDEETRSFGGQLEELRKRT